MGDTNDDQPMTEEYRQVVRAATTRGVASLRAGRVSDGEAFMARMDKELAQLERHGR